MNTRHPVLSIYSTRNCKNLWQ